MLASQIIYSRAALGDRATFVTVLGENHGRMMVHLRPIRFFDERLAPDQVSYISGYQALETDGLRGLSTLIRREVTARRSDLLVLDGVSTLDTQVGSDIAVKRFTHELQTLASSTGCTMFLLTTSDSDTTPERTMVDGLIELKQRLFGARNERRLQLRKIRGTGSVEGEHAFRIDDGGVTVFPRTEAVLRQPVYTLAPDAPQILSTGVASLDAMLGGGLPPATVTSMVGPSGAGKTTLALQMLARSTPERPGLLFGCFETPERLVVKAASLGLDLDGLIARAR